MPPKEKTTGLRLARNVRQLREARRLTIRQLAAAMTNDMGRKILSSGIVKIEKGERGVDADDLVALALIFGVSPNRLLLTDGVPDETVALTPTQQASAISAWWWATGEQRLPGPYAVSDEQFVAENRPHDPAGTTTIAELRKLAADGRLDTLRRGAAEARAAGLGVGEIAELLALWELDDADQQLRAERRTDDGQR
jgi:transcriptional regulator with XRE-family HTH domain